MTLPRGGGLHSPHSSLLITTGGESDYTRRLIRPLHFGPTANRTQCPTIFIDEDTTYEVDEVFEIRIAAALSSSAVAVLPSMAKITILDDDSEFVCMWPFSFTISPSLTNLQLSP